MIMPTQILNNGVPVSIFDDTVDVNTALATAYASLVAAGVQVGSLTAANPPLPVPASISMFQARAALLQTPGPSSNTMLDVVNAYVTANASTNPALTLAWEYSASVERKSVFVNSLMGVFGISPSEMDQLFFLGATINS
jgi:hypothetical protein